MSIVVIIIISAIFINSIRIIITGLVEIISTIGCKHSNKERKNENKITFTNIFYKLSLSNRGQIQ
jgi:hypothetical protein